jgi:protein-serine/threonine kinase
MNGPASPSLPFSEDLTRFPSESLHSFSFAHQSSDSLQNRQQVLKRSIDFMRDKLGWAASSPRIASAQARLAGDEDLLSMMELLQKANMMGHDSSFHESRMSIDRGPLTGPAHLYNDNVFEKSFTPQREDLVESPTGEDSLDKITDEVAASNFPPLDPGERKSRTATAQSGTDEFR